LVATVLGTPLSFYSMLFWEHTWGIALLLAGAAVLLTLAAMDRPSVWGGALGGGFFAGGALMRREVLIPALLVLILIPVFFRTRSVFLMCVAAVAVLVISLGLIFELRPEPLLEGLTHASPGRAPGALGSTRLQRIEWLTSGSYATALFVLFSLVMIGLRHVKPGWLIPAFALCSPIVSLAFAIQLFSHYTWSNLNPLAFCPLAVWGVWSILVLPSRDKGRTAFLVIWSLCLTGAAATVFMATDYGAGQWGPRYLLFVFPLLILLAFRAAQEMRKTASGNFAKHAFGLSFAGLLALSVLMQGVGLGAIVTGKQELSQAQNAIAHLEPRFVVSGDSSVGELAPLAAQKTLLFAPKAGDLAVLMKKLWEDGRKGVVVICAPPAKCQWNGFRGWAHGPIVSRDKKVFQYAVYRVEEGKR
jgi:hypothetical protein